MRVALVVNESQASIGVSGPFKVTDANTGALLWSSSGLPASPAQAGAGGMWLSTLWLASSEVKLVPERDGNIQVNGRYYRGHLLLRSVGNALTVLNLVDMERYLASVVGSEVIESWPDDALRAQAVAARTYALYKMKSSGNQPFDVQATVADQVYLGTERETAKLRRIVNETSGVVLLYNGKVFPAYFHSTCAGHTEEVSRALKYETIPPLRGVVCNYCSSSKYYGWWTTVISADSLTAALRRAGKNVGRVTDIQPIDIGPSGRALNVKVVHDRGMLVMNAYEFRKLVGASQMRNTNFMVRNYGDSFEILGRGWGHGVGMCQYGAKGMAEKGYSFVAILKYYYPGAVLAQLY